MFVHVDDHTSYKSHTNSNYSLRTIEIIKSIIVKAINNQDPNQSTKQKTQNIYLS